MTVTTETTAVVRRYIEVWNERDAARRAAAMEAALTEDSVYSDPDYEGLEGHAALSEAIDRAQERFGDLRFELGEVLGAHHGHVLFTWRLGAPGAEPAATGYDAAEIAADGRLRRVVGFF
ncbi:nuclear transport factor 2 family protein [Actinomadura kijaniata]|uniref:nuclear transport factor 2 family protein n=1 Tax=Actinomadura kijaniata TaxID=46161 RepID=UPI00082AD023|nr:nuclear transport factor 2 family protein [Actinomadura kijaniata]